MKEPTYREALRASWRLAWHHKNLWPFGLFAMLWGQFGLFELLLKVWSVMSVRSNQTMWDWCQMFLNKDSWEQIRLLLGIGPDRFVWVLWLLVMLLGLALALTFVATITQGALVYAGAKFSKFRLSYPDEVKAWHVGVKHFWRVFGLNILRKFIVSWAGLLAVWAAFRLAAEPSVGWGLLLGFGFLFAITVGVIASFLLIYAVGYVVVEEYSFGESLGAAWRLFWRHPMVSLEVGGVVLFLNIGLVLFALFSVLYTFFLPIIIGSYAVVMFQLPIIGKIVGGLSYTFFLAVLMAAGAIFTIYTTTLWSYLFSKMHSTSFTSKLVRLLRR